DPSPVDGACGDVADGTSLDVDVESLCLHATAHTIEATPSAIPRTRGPKRAVIVPCTRFSMRAAWYDTPSLRLFVLAAFFIGGPSRLAAWLATANRAPHVTAQSRVARRGGG